jgi:hypothetical protein
VVGLGKVRAIWVYGEEEEKRVFEDLLDVVKAELNTIDLLVEDFLDTVCSEAEISDYKDYYKVVLSDRISVYNTVRELYVAKTKVEIIVIPVKVIVREDNEGDIEFTVAKAQYFLTARGGCYKYHRVEYDVIIDTAKAIIANSIAEAEEVDTSE